MLPRHLHQSVLLDRCVLDLLELDKLRFAEYFDSVEFACGNMGRFQDLNIRSARLSLANMNETHSRPRTAP